MQKKGIDSKDLEKLVQGLNLNSGGDIKKQNFSKSNYEEEKVSVSNENKNDKELIKGMR